MPQLNQVKTNSSISLNKSSHLAIVLTDRCNLSCKYCIHDSAPGRCREIGFEELKQTILTADRLGYKYVGLTGGELLLYSHYRELIEFVCQLKWRVLIESNTSLLTDEILDFIHSNTEDRLIFQTSLDSHIAPLHDNLRGKGTFRNTVENIKKIKVRGINSKVNMIVTPYNLIDEDLLREYLDLIDSLGVDSVSIGRVVASGRGIQKYQLSQQQCQRVKEAIERIDSPKITGHSFRAINRIGSCNRLSNGTLGVSPSGIHPCIFNTNMVLGKLSELEAVLQSGMLPTLNNLRKAAKAECDKQIFGCADCHLLLNDYLAKLKKIQVVTPEQGKTSKSASSPEKRDDRTTTVGDTFPETVEVLTTNECQMGCSFCHFDCRKSGEHLAWPVMKKLLEEGRRIGVRRINFSGGEPLVYRHLTESLQLARKLEYYVLLMTNGWNFQQLKPLLLNQVNYLIVGLEGMTGETHDRIKGMNGSFLRARRAIEECRRAQLSVGVRYVVLPENYHEVGELLTFCSDLGIKDLMLFHSFDDGRARGKYDLLLDDKQIKELREIIAAHPEQVKRISGLKCNYLADKVGTGLCRYLSKSFAVDWRGRVNICSLSCNDDIAFPSLHNKSLQQCLEERGRYVQEHRNVCCAERPTWKPDFAFQYCEFCLNRFRERDYLCDIGQRIAENNSEVLEKAGA